MRTVQAKASVTTVDDYAIPDSELELKSHRIWLSNVVVVRRAKVKRKWHVNGLRRLIVMVIVHGLAMFAPFTFNWGALGVAVVLHVLTGMLGITLSFHRNLTHRSFRLVKWLEYLFAYFGCLALQMAEKAIEYELKMVKCENSHFQAKSQKLREANDRFAYESEGK
ncbi:hypothetical protein KSS87_015582 [Heliosperma pusillum]|nr:hypothetical protein KSS87_015582 [Heliosperma pusillum]